MTIQIIHNITVDIVDVGDGTEESFAGVDMSGKAVLTTKQALPRVAEHGAVAVIVQNLRSTVGTVTIMEMARQLAGYNVRNTTENQAITDALHREFIIQGSLSVQEQTPEHHHSLHLQEGQGSQLRA